jgi:hypothetical protein
MSPQFDEFGASGCSQSAQIALMQNELATLTVQFTERHPRITILQERIDALQEECDQALANDLASGVGLTIPSNTTQQPLEVNSVYQNLRIQLSDAELELVELSGELESGTEVLAALRRDVDKIVQVETDLKQLDRDYEVVSRRHQELLMRWEDLQAKKRLDVETDSVQFRIIEPPFAFADPVAPNRAVLLSITLLFAIGAGGAIAFGLNQMQPTFFTRQMLGRRFDLPVIGSVSMIMTDTEKGKRRRAALAWASSGLALVVCFGLVVAFAGPGSALTREFLSRVGL